MWKLCNNFGKNLAYLKPYDPVQRPGFLFALRLMAAGRVCYSYKEKADIKKQNEKHVLIFANHHLVLI